VRTKTPSELKWLLVERATVAGNVDRLRKLHQSIAEELRQAEITLRSLDQATNLLYERVNAQAAGFSKPILRTMHVHKIAKN